MVEAFLAEDSPASSVSLPSALLFHGPNEGLGYVYAKRLVSHLLEEAEGLVRLSAEALSANKGRLHEALSSPSLFGGRRVVWMSIREGERMDISCVAAALEALPSKITAQSSIMIATAGILRKDSALRRAFEKHGGAMACYEENPLDYVPMLKKIFSKAEVRATPQMLNELARAMPQDRQAAMGEAEKIALFYGKGGEIDDSAFPLLCEWGETQIFDLLYLAFDGNTRACLTGLASCAPNMAIPLVRAVARHIRQVMYLQNRCGRDRACLAKEIAALRPFVLFALRERLLRQAMLWRGEVLAMMLRESLECEQRMKGVSALSWLIAERFVLRISQRAERASS